MGFLVQDGGSIWSSVIVSHQTDWLFDCWHLGFLDCPPYDVVQLTAGCDVVV